MTDWHRVRTKDWPEMRGLSRNAKLLRVYVLTCAHRITEGLYHLPIAYASEDLELSPAATKKALAELVDRKFVSYDAKAQVVLILDALTHSDQVPKSRTQLAGAVKLLGAVPASPLWDVFRAMAQTHAPELAAAVGNGTLFDQPNGIPHA